MFSAPIDVSSSNKKNEDQPIVRVLIDDLFPGVEYKFDIHTTSYNLISDLTQLSARTLPLIQSEVLVVNNDGERDTVTLSYTPTPQTSSKFDMYRFSLGDPDIPDKEKLANDTDRKVTFTGNGTHSKSNQMEFPFTNSVHSLILIQDSFPVVCTISPFGR